MKSCFRKAISLILCMALTTGCWAASAEQAAEQFAEVGQELTAEEMAALNAELEEVFEDPSAKIREQYGIPSRYDLREEGVVTPVKLQWPWGSCWAIATVAAAEISVLSAMGTTYEETPLNLSTSHAIWYLYHQVTEEDDPAQAGEGMFMDPSREPETYFTSGFSDPIAQLFATGAGPVDAKLFPYRGKNGTMEADVALYDPEKWKENYRRFTKNLRRDPFEFLSEEEMAQYGEGNLDPAALERAEAKAHQAVDDMVEAALQDKLKEIETGTYLQYDRGDDWTIPETDESGNSNRTRTTLAVLTDVNSLPDVTDKDAGGKATLNKVGMDAVKEELLKGHGVTLHYRAEAYTPGRENTNYYYNFETWSHYTSPGDLPDEPNGSGHVVCVVGWDDDYPAENFTHEVLVPDGNGGRTVSAEWTDRTTPPGNGAWLIKNSRGSETDAIPDAMVSAVDGKAYPENYSKYGITDENGRHTGYDWISYYDSSLRINVSMAFEASQSGDQTKALQYDYLVFQTAEAIYNYYEESEKPLLMANVFTAPEDTELRAVAVQTPGPNCRVKYTIYRLDENAKNPEDGEIAETLTVSHDYAGYHRSSLVNPVSLRKGERFSVVADCSFVNKEGKRMHARLANSAEPDTAKVVVNPGESFLTVDGTWTDLTEVRGKLRAELFIPEEISTKVIDNFPIKAFITDSAAR